MEDVIDNTTSGLGKHNVVINFHVIENVTVLNPLVENAFENLDIENQSPSIDLSGSESEFVANTNPVPGALVENPEHFVKVSWDNMADQDELANNFEDEGNGIFKEVPMKVVKKNNRKKITVKEVSVTRSKSGRDKTSS